MIKTIRYIQYFFYIAINWNLRIAIHILREEIKGEKKYGIDTTGADELKQLEKRGIDIDNATIYMPVSYGLLESVFSSGINLNKNNNASPDSDNFNFPVNIAGYRHFLDIGCGKGRALCVAAHHGAKKITGIDFSKELCETANLNCTATRKKFPDLQYEIIHNDAFYFEIPDDADCIFMFNPFDDVIMSGVARNIADSFESNPRKITLVYVNPVCFAELTDIGFKSVYHYKKMKYIEVIIAELNV